MVVRFTKLSLLQLVLPLLVQVLLIALAGGAAYQVWLTQDEALQHLQLEVQQAAVAQSVRQQVEQTLYRSGRSQALPVSLQEKQEKVQHLLHHLQQVLRLQGKTEEAFKLQQHQALLEQAIRQEPGSSLASKPKQVKQLEETLQATIMVLPAIELKALNTTLSMYRSSSLSSLWLTGFFLFTLGLVLAVFTMRHLWQLYTSLQHSSSVQLAVQEQERQRLAQDLHDGAIQELVVLKRRFGEEEKNGLIVNAVIQEIRRICHNLKPVILEDLGLAVALTHLAKQASSAKLLVKVQLEEEEAINALPYPVALVLYRCVQELLTNVLKHANASYVGLTVVYVPKESPLLRLYVVDDGVGFSRAGLQQHQGLGLRGIEERLHPLGGTAKWEPTRLGQAKPGTRVTLQLPIEAKKQSFAERFYEWLNQRKDTPLETNAES